jgi:hypothetical protein
MEQRPDGTKEGDTMTECCSHCHGRFDGFLRDIGRLFWALVATVAGMWLILAMEMLRRSRTQQKHEAGAKTQGLFLAGDDPLCGYRAKKDRGHDR